HSVAVRQFTVHSAAPAPPRSTTLGPELMHAAQPPTDRTADAPSRKRGIRARVPTPAPVRAETFTATGDRAPCNAATSGRARRTPPTTRPAPPPGRFAAMMARPLLVTARRDEPRWAGPTAATSMPAMTAASIAKAVMGPGNTGA